MRKVINVLFALSMVFLMWVVASTVEVAAKNLDADPTYSAMNFYKVCYKVETA